MPPRGRGGRGRGRAKAGAKGAAKRGAGKAKGKAKSKAKGKRRATPFKDRKSLAGMLEFGSGEAEEEASSTKGGIFDDEFEDPPEEEEPSSTKGSIFDAALSSLHKYPVFTLPVPKCRPAPPELRSPTGYMPELCRCLLNRLNNQEQHGVYLFLRKYFLKFKFASFCAGTDSPKMVLDCIFATCFTMLVSKLGEPDFKAAVAGYKTWHAFSAESDMKKRIFLRSMYDLPAGETLLFGDVKGLAGKEATNFSHGEHEPPTSQIPKFNFAVGGFPCKDVSSYNVNRAKNTGNVRKKTGKTGGALAGILDTVSEHADPDGFIGMVLENVLGLSTPPVIAEDGKKRRLDIHASNLAATLNFLDVDVNQFAFALALDPRSFGGAQARGRYRLWGRVGFGKCGVSLQCYRITIVLLYYSITVVLL